LGTLALGFGLSGLVIAVQAGGTNASTYVLLAALAFALALGMLSLGFLVGVLARKTTVAISVALFLWLTLVFVGDLGLMGTALAFKLPISTLFHMALINPLQTFKMFSLISINATLDVLGPAGMYAMQTYRESLSWLFLGALMVWIIAPLAVSFVVFQKRGDV
jgi:Cu-processing system permease protein